MSYYQKYLKYKKKYLELKNNQKGGYHLSDRTEGFLLHECIERIGSNVNYFNFDENGNKLPGYEFDETFNFLLKDETYNQIFVYLISNYKNNEPYEQLFQKRSGETIANFNGMIRYHINIGALMFLSFIIELEIFTLFHSIIPFNTISNPSRNDLPAAFECRANEGLCTRKRIFKNEVSSDVIAKFINFTERLDNIFNDFMTKFIEELTGMINTNSLEILKCIVPVDDWRYKKGKFNFIFVDWKERILKITKLDQDITRNMINIKLNETMKKIQNQQLMHYIAEATGFFSYMYLVDPNDTTLLYGSCITYSMFELYIMSRLHIPGDKLNLLIEKEHLGPHKFWQITQKRTSIPTLTHYATKFPFSSLPLEFRSIFKSNGIVELPFSTNKNKILKLFIYIIFDMNIRYFLPHLQDEKVLKILYFIRNRINKIESLLGSNDIIESLNTDVKIRNYLIELSTSDSSILNNIDLDKVFENPNIRQIISSLEIDRLIFNAISRNNLELVEKIINLGLPLDINMRYQGKSILEALLSTRINNIYSYLFMKIIKKLKDLKFLYEINNVLQNISVNNIDLYTKIKAILIIPNLTYDSLLLDKVYSKDYITNEILINPNLIKEINERRNERGQSLLYILCSFKLDHTIFYILNVNEISKRFLINVNVQNLYSLSTPLHGLLWHGIANEEKKYMVNTIIKLLKRNGLNINIKNKHNSNPIEELDKNETITLKEKELIKKILI
jgi:hypothetical protein